MNNHESSGIFASLAQDASVHLRQLRNKGSARRGAALLALGTAGGQALVVLSSPVLTRLYSPGDMGVLSVYSATVLVLLAMASLRYELAIPTAKSPRRASGLLALSLVLVVAISIAAALLLPLIGNRFARSVGVPGLAKWLWLVPISVASGGVFQAINFWAVREREYGRIAATRFVQSAAQVGLQVGLATVTKGPLGLLVGDSTGRALGSSTISRGIDWRSLARRLRPRALLGTAVCYKRFPKVMLPAAVLNLLALQLPFFLIPRAFGGAVAGQYFLAYRVLILPASLIGGAMAQVFFGEIAGRKDDRPALARMAGGFASALLLVNIPLYAAFLVAGPDLFRFVFGSAWKEAGNFAQLLAPMVMIWSVASPLSSLLVVGDRLAESLAFTTAELVVKLLAILVGSYYGSIILAVALLSALGLALSIISVRRFLRVADLGLGSLLSPLKLALIASVPMALLVGASLLDMQPVIQFLLAAVLVPVSWVLAFQLRRQSA